MCISTALSGYSILDLDHGIFIIIPSVMCTSSQHLLGTPLFLFSTVALNQLHSKDKFSCQLNQSISYVHSCLDLVILIPMSTINPSRKSVVLEYSALKPSRSFGLAEDLRTTDENVLGVVGVKGWCN